MLTSSIETHPASRSLAFIDSSFQGDWFVVSTILPQKRAIVLNSHWDQVELATPALPQNASTFGKIDSPKIVCQDSAGKPRLGFAIHRWFQLKLSIELQKSQFPKWYSSLTENTQIAVDGCDLGTLPGFKFVRNLKSHSRQSFARFEGRFQNSNLFLHADRNSDTVFGGRTRDRLFDNDTAILNCLQCSTDKTLLSLYCGSVLHSILEVLQA